MEIGIQRNEKRRLAAELKIAGKEHEVQIKDAGMKSAELLFSNNELEHFAYLASHDLKQPMRTISNYIGLLADRYLPQLDADARKYIEATQDAARRMSALIETL